MWFIAREAAIQILKVKKPKAYSHCHLYNKNKIFKFYEYMMIRSDSQTSKYKISKFIVRNILLNKLMVIHVHISQLKNNNCKKLWSFLLKIQDYK